MTRWPSSITDSKDPEANWKIPCKIVTNSGHGNEDLNRGETPDVLGGKVPILSLWAVQLPGQADETPSRPY